MGTISKILGQSVFIPFGSSSLSMDSRCNMLPSSSSHIRSLIYAKPKSSWIPSKTTLTFKPRKYESYYCRSSCGIWLCFCYHHEQKTVFNKSFKNERKAKEYSAKVSKEPVTETKKKGTISGAVALVIGTSIGSGILALPQKAFPAGLVPSSISIIVCWGFLLIEALLLVEINVGLRRQRKQNGEDNGLEVVSIRTMAQETLGDWGGVLATVTYIFLGYSSMIAYCSKSGELLFHMINLPESVSGCLFTALFTMLISIGGTRATDNVNQWLTVVMIGLLMAIEVLAVLFGDWSGLAGRNNWGKVPATIPAIVFSLVYHDLIPVLCAYLEGDIQRLKVSIFIGSIVPLIGLLVWDAIALSLAAQADQIVDPVELLMRVRWNGVPFMVGAFSLLAVGTSLIGTLLSFSEFFKEQLNKIQLDFPSIKSRSKAKRNLWGRNNISIMAMAMVVAPSLLVSVSFPEAFSAATEIAGGYCMTVLYGVLPPTMALTMHRMDNKALSNTKPALVGVGACACGFVIEQIVQDILALQP